jgi:hypothetical protein
VADPTDRFQDPGASLDAFLDEVLVRCPRCEGLAHVAPVPAEQATGGPTRAGASADRRLVCPGCALVRTWPPAGAKRTYTTGGPFDPWFHEPLWLRAEVVGELLWAYNLAHLTLLEDFVAATKRVRGDGGSLHHSVVTRLPSWVKEARHREPLLAALARMRASL